MTTECQTHTNAVAMASTTTITTRMTTMIMMTGGVASRGPPVAANEATRAPTTARVATEPAGATRRRLIASVLSRRARTWVSTRGRGRRPHPDRTAEAQGLGSCRAVGALLSKNASRRSPHVAAPLGIEVGVALRSARRASRQGDPLLLLLLLPGMVMVMHTSESHSEQAHQWTHHRQQDRCQGMGSTALAAVLANNRAACIAMAMTITAMMMMLPRWRHRVVAITMAIVMATVEGGRLQRQQEQRPEEAGVESWRRAAVGVTNHGDGTPRRRAAAAAAAAAAVGAGAGAGVGVGGTRVVASTSTSTSTMMIMVTMMGSDMSGRWSSRLMTMTATT